MKESEIPRNIMDLARNPDLKATVRLGRNGLTASIIEEIRVQLSARSVVKIRLNRGFADGGESRSEIFTHLEEQVSARCIFSRGNVAVLWKRT
tara:strand:- start:72 stop:350 length:279 start_codon:yes stop_codon:yes gene_type:complete